ncbi:MAG: hypothetical protein AAGA99_12155 [Actinomycetota bacterium]
MAIWSGAELQLLPENATQRRIVPTQGIAHTAVDAKGRTRLWRYFGRSDVHAETHLWFPFSGPPVQMMDTEVEADANRLADARAVSWETEDDGDPVGNPWNDHQLEQQAQFMVWLHQRHGIPAVQIPFGDDRAPGFGWHAMHGFDDPIAQTGRRDNPWSFFRGKTCPGPTRIRQFVDELLPEVQRRVGLTTQEDDLTPEEHQWLAEVRSAIMDPNRWGLRPRLQAIDEAITGVGDQPELVERIAAAINDQLPEGTTDLALIRKVVREELDRTVVGGQLGT